MFLSWEAEAEGTAVIVDWGIQVASEFSGYTTEFSLREDWVLHLGAVSWGSEKPSPLWLH